MLIKQECVDNKLPTTGQIMKDIVKCETQWHLNVECEFWEIAGSSNW